MAERADLRRAFRRVSREQMVILGVLALALFAATWLLASRVEGGVDWLTAQRPATLAALRGQSPYSINLDDSRPNTSYFYNPPWALIPLIPLAVLPPVLGRALFVTAGVLAFGYAAFKLGATPLDAVLFLTSPPVLMGLWNANIDWLVVLGFALPPPIGLLFATIKPQMSVAFVVFWLLKAWKEGRFREVLRVFGPLLLMTLLSLALYGLWPLEILGSPVDAGFNASFWPLGLPIGFVLLAAALKHDDARYAMVASPFFTPYVVFHSYVGAVVGMIDQKTYFRIVIASLWLIGVIQYAIKF